MTEPVPVLQIMHGYNAPFGDLAFQYAAAFDPDRYRVLTLFLTGSRDPALEQAFGLGRVRFLDLDRRCLRGLKLGLIRVLLRLHREFPYQLVIGHRYKALYSALLASLLLPPLRVVGVAHAFDVLARPERRRLLRLLQRRVYLLGVSQAVADDLLRDCPFLGSQRVGALLNVLDTPSMVAGLLPRDQARRELGLGASEFVFANVGRYHPDKDQACLLRAFSRIAPEFPSARLLLIGDGRLRGELESQVRALGLEGRALLVGPVPRVSRLFAAFDVYCSSSDREPFGIVLTEAMAARLPVISTDCGGAPEVLGEAADYFRRGDDAALAGLMQQLYRMSSAERSAIGDRLFRRLETEFSPAAFRRRMMLARPLADWFSSVGEH